MNAVVDIMTDRLSGKICTTQHNNVIVWNGHLCEGANLTARHDNFCLWTRCGKHDVPANKAREGSFAQVDCVDCLKMGKPNELPSRV